MYYKETYLFALESFSLSIKKQGIILWLKDINPILKI